MAFIIVGDIIGGNPLVAGILLNQQALLVQEVIGLSGGKASVIQYLMMVHKHLGSLGEGDFVKGRINFTPESSAPGIIQFFDSIVILVFQEVAECYFCRLTIIELYGRLVIKLPAYDAWIIAVMLCQLFYHLVGELPISWRGE